MIFVGDNVRAASYNETLFKQAGLLPGRLGSRLIEDNGENDTGFTLATDELSHPIVSFFAPTELQPLLAQPRFFRAFSVELSPEGPVQVVARFAGGQPAIVERKVGRGTVLLFACTADKDWTDFPLRPAFLPVIRRAIEHITLGRRARKTVQVHERIVDVLSLHEAGAQVTVRDPRGGVRQVAATPTPTGDLAQVEVTGTHFAGIYELTRAGKPARISFFAANPPRRESNLAALTQAELRIRYPNLDFHWITKHDDLRRILIEQRVGREIWPLLLALTFACLLAESILAVRWAPRET